MNGLSLLVALATVGVDVGWESTSTGKLAYTIRIESVLVDKLSDGSAIESVVDRSDRGLREFRVAVGPKNNQTERAATATANEVDYGWRPNETGAIDYYVQISRERLETLSRGIPLQCQVHPDVPEIQKIYVFVGDSQLPRELPPGTRSSTTQPRDINSVDSRGNVTPVSGTDTNSSPPRYGTSGYGTQSPQGNSNNNQTYAPPTTYGPEPSSNYGSPAASSPNRYGQYNDNTLPVPPLDNSRPPNYGYNGNQYATQQDPYNRQQTQQTYAPPLAQTAALPQQQQYISTPAPALPAPVQAAASPAPAAANQSIDALAAVLALQQKQLESAKPPAVVAEAKPQSSKPLILTTLALFASIGANAYLGWLAWSFFWRFRDASSDLSRARSNAFPAGSIAGH